MALNFSHRPVFPAHLAEENLVSPIRIANGSLDGFGRPWPSNWEVENLFDYGRDRFDMGESQESVSNDIIDLLPSDPFGMDISTTFTAITGWLEDLEVDYGGYGRDEAVASDGSYKLFAELNFIWNRAMRGCQAFPAGAGVDHEANAADGFGWSSVEKGGAGASCHVRFELNSAENSTSSLGNGSWGVASGGQSGGSGIDGNGNFSNDDGGAPPGGLVFAFGHLGVRDLLVLESVSKSLQSTIRGDPFYWSTIHIEQPLNEKITDDILLYLTKKAQGNLQCLSLVECPRITDDGLRRVLESNPKLTKLSVPGCTRLTIDGIMNSLRAFNSTGTQGVKHLRIGGIFGMKPEIFEEMKSLLGTGGQMQQSARKPRFHIRGSLYVPCDDDRDIDIETCPRCQNQRLVYDCPSETCQEKDHATQLCRACTLCIARCVKCGRCINDNEYEETFCLELLCGVCWREVKCEDEKQDRKVGLTPSKSAVPVEQDYSFCLHG